MSRLLSIIFCCTFLCKGFAQGGSDMLILKKGNRSLKTWIPGMEISFWNSAGNFVSGRIDSIRNNNIYMTQAETIRYQTGLGNMVTDTMARYYVHYPITEIYRMPKQKKWSSVSGDGILMIGGAFFLALNLANTAIKKDQLFTPKNNKYLAIESGALLSGFIWHKLKKDYIRVGNRYHFVYVNMGK